MDQRKHDIQSCPVCSHELTAVELSCDGCGTSIRGRFGLGSLGFEQLSSEQRYFVLTFLRCRGNIKEVERELGISYPTVRNRLDGILEALGYRTESKRSEPARKEILDDLEAGRIDPAEAARRLKGK